MQRTTVKLASSSIQSYSKVDPTTTKSSGVVYGPYKDVAPFAFEELFVHSMNNKPFARFTSAIREVEISHWGNVAIEEIYELVHAGIHINICFPIAHWFNLMLIDRSDIGRRIFAIRLPEPKRRLRSCFPHASCYPACRGI